MHNEWIVPHSPQVNNKKRGWSLRWPILIQLQWYYCKGHNINSNSKTTKKCYKWDRWVIWELFRWAGKHLKLKFRISGYINRSCKPSDTMASQKQGIITLDQALQWQYRGTATRSQSQDRKHWLTQNQDIFYEKQVLRQKRGE